MAGDIAKEELDRRVAELTGEGATKTGEEKDKGKGKETRPRPRPAFKGAESSKSAAVMVTDDDHDDKDGNQRDDEDEDEDELPVAIGTKCKAATQWVVSGVNEPKVRLDFLYPMCFCLIHLFSSATTVGSARAPPNAKRSRTTRDAGGASTCARVAISEASRWRVSG
jgi:hypothetical protein